MAGWFCRLFLQTGFYISRQAFILEVEVSQVLPHTPFTFALPFGQRFSIPLRAGDRWFRACYFWNFWAFSSYEWSTKIVKPQLKPLEL